MALMRPRSAFNLGSLASSLASTSYASSAGAPTQTAAVSSSVAGAAAVAAAGFHSSSAVSETKRKKVSRMRRKANEEKQELKALIWERTKPDPVLGHQTNDQGEELWRSSELASLILSKDEVWGYKEDRRGNLVPVEARGDAGDEGQPSRKLNFGLTQDDAELLFKDLPTVMVDDGILDSRHIHRKDPEGLEILSEELNAHTSIETEKAGVLARVLDLQNASGKGIQVENIRRITNHFGARGADEAGEKGLDTGSPEVQAAVLTYRIRNLHEHLESGARHDNQNRRSMTMLVHKRAKLLKYLRRTSPARYEAILPRLGLEPRAVEGEIVVGGKPRMRMM